MKGITICDTLLSIFVYALISTALVFICPYLWEKMQTKKEKVMANTITVILFCLLAVLWFNISDDSNCKIPKKLKKSSTSHASTILKTVPSFSSGDTPVLTREIKKPKINIVVSKASILEKARIDTQKPTYDLKGASIYQSAVGDHASVTNNTYSEYHLEDKDKQFILNGIISLKKQTNIINDTLVVGLTLYSNGAVYAYELVEFLRHSGYPVLQINGWIITPNQVLKNITVQPKDGKIQFIVGVMEKK